MQIVGNEMTDHVEKIVTLFNVLLSAILAKLSKNFSATIQTVFFCTILFMTHTNGIDQLNRSGGKD